MTMSSVSGGAYIDLIPYDIFLAPGETLTISAQADNNAKIGVSINWTEDI
jgi:hypothetical protein